MHAGGAPQPVTLQSAIHKAILLKAILLNYVLGRAEPTARKATGM